MAEPYSGGTLGISGDAIAKIPPGDDLYLTIVECLRSGKEEDVTWGLFFSEALLGRSVPDRLLFELRARLPSLIEDKRDAIREAAVPVAIVFRKQLSEYRSLMLRCLRDRSPIVRRQVLEAFETFLTREDIELLLDFQSDDYMTETEMGSSLIYGLRNKALVVIEALCGRRFDKTEKVEMLVGENRMVYWWDWQPFLDWWRKKS